MPETMPKPQRRSRSNGQGEREPGGCKAFVEIADIHDVSDG